MSFKLGNANVYTWRKNTDKVVSRLYMQFPIRKANFLCNKHNLGSEFLISHIISGLDEYFNQDIIYKSKYIRLNNYMYLINAHMHRNTRLQKKLSLTIKCRFWLAAHGFSRRLRQFTELIKRKFNVMGTW